MLFVSHFLKVPLPLQVVDTWGAAAPDANAVEDAVEDADVAGEGPAAAEMHPPDLQMVALGVDLQQAKGDTTWQKANAKYRKTAAEWVSVHSVAYPILIRLIVQGFVILMRRLFDISGAA